MTSYLLACEFNHILSSFSLLNFFQSNELFKGAGVHKPRGHLRGGGGQPGRCRRNLWTELFEKFRKMKQNLVEILQNRAKFTTFGQKRKFFQKVKD